MLSFNPIVSKLYKHYIKNKCGRNNDIAYNSHFDLSQSISVRNEVNTRYCLVEENIDGPM